MAKIDWAAIWRDMVESSRAPADVAVPNDDWWARPRHHHRPPEERWQRPNMFLGQVLAGLSPSATIVDVGAGTGAWTIPLAQRAARVTAVEPSPEMMEILRQRARRAGVENVTFVPSRWEDAHVEPHDLVVCSHGMYASPEIVPFLEKIQRTATRGCYLVMRVTSRHNELGELWRDMQAAARPEEPHLIVAYNVLYSMGIHANVVIQPQPSYWISRTLEDALDLARDILRLPDDKHDDALLRDHLTRLLSPVEGGLRWPGGLRAGMIWWNKDQPGE